MKHNIKEIREESIAELKAALEELESGEGLSRFVGGHGLMSRMFEFSRSEPTLEIDFRLPYARVLMDEESQKADEAENSMAILLLTAEGQKSESPEKLSLNVWSKEEGTGYALHVAEEFLVPVLEQIHEAETVREVPRVGEEAPAVAQEAVGIGARLGDDRERIRLGAADGRSVEVDGAGETDQLRLAVAHVERRLAELRGVEDIKGFFAHDAVRVDGLLHQ